MQVEKVEKRRKRNVVEKMNAYVFCYYLHALFCVFVLVMLSMCHVGYGYIYKLVIIIEEGMISRRFTRLALGFYRNSTEK